VTSPTRATTDGRAYLDLRRKARQDRRPVDELMQLYVLECFLARLAETRFASQFVLKGGVLLAAFGERRPTRDIDLQAQDFDNEPAKILAAITEIAAEHLDDGVMFDTSCATAEIIREEDHYPGVRVSIAAQLATARPRLHVDVSVGDPISPKPANVTLPRVLGGEIIVCGYPLAMVHAEKIVTAIARGTTSTRWRDFADIYLLARHHAIDGNELSTSIREVARHRGTNLAPLDQTLAGYGAIGQQRWHAWRRKQLLDDRLPASFADVLESVIAFADPAITGRTSAETWNPATGTWS
jgi:nucleotidyltransferase AbiEii toxin of type IV toxin-antitoxin system